MKVNAISNYQNGRLNSKLKIKKHAEPVLPEINFRGSKEVMPGAIMGFLAGLIAVRGDIEGGLTQLLALTSIGAILGYFLDRNSDDNSENDNSSENNNFFASF